jgi:CHASE2 domain-containing sensor protein
MRSPFPGLRPFGDDDADGALFAGRDDEIDLVVANLRSAALTILYGPSGVGKTSLLHAGVVRRINVQASAAEAGGSPAPTIVVHDEWAGDAGGALARRIQAATGDDAPNASLHDALDAWLAARRGMLLLIFDQFEEYLRLHPQEEQEGFGDLLPEVVERMDPRIHVLVCLRDDALAELDRFEDRIPGLFANYLRLPQMTESAARDAILEPIASVNGWRGEAGLDPVAVEDGLVEDVLEGLVDATLSSLHAEAAEAPVASRGTIEPAFLQLVMRRLWESDIGAGGAALSRSTLAALGGAASIVRAHLDDAVGTLTAPQQQLAAAMFGYLVTPSGAKVRYTVEDLASYTGHSVDEVSAILGALCRPELRIMRQVPAPSGEPEAHGFEIFHDVLGPALRGWAQRIGSARLEQRNMRLRAVVAALLAIAVALIAYSADPVPLKRLELDTIGMRFAVTGHHSPDPAIAIVGIDDRTTSRQHVTRAENARVLEAVAAGHPTLIVETIEFEQADTPGTSELRAALRRTSATERLGGPIRVLLATSRIDGSGNTTLFGSARATSFSGAEAAYAGFAVNAAGTVGKLLAEGRQIDASGVPAPGALRGLDVRAAQLSGARVDRRRYPAWIDFAGGPGTYPHTSFIDVLDGSVDPAAFRDRIVVIGDVSSVVTGGAAGLRTVADASSRMAPAEVHANAIATVRDELPLRDAAGAVDAVLIVALAALASWLSVRRWSRLVAFGLCVGAALLFVVASVLAFDAGWVVAVVAPLIALVVSAVANPAIAPVAGFGLRGSPRG